nr:suppressor of tumorigenicity 7 protein-like isoform X1 [Paramormyrops kingsleyae]
MADTSNPSGQNLGFTEKLKTWLSWSWTYIWALWFAMVLVLIYVLRSPLKLQETLSTASVFLNTLTPKFYVALTGTSSLISGLILIFEWWYFQKYGTSFIEQVSVSHLRPLLGGMENSSSAGLFSANGDAESRQSVSECKVWRNPLNLFRGSEYSRYTWVTGKEPLTYYDMNLSAQDHQTFFTCDTQQLKPEDVVMQKAWRERNPQARIKAAYQAIELNKECASAYVLLAEEEATTITEAERLLKQALRSAGKDTNVLAYIKRRLAMCARKLGRVKDAVKMIRELMKEFPLLGMLNIHENLLEALLEMQAYADVQAVLAKYDDISLPKSATICYTSALLKARAVSDKFSPEAASRRGLSTAEMNAVEAIHRAVEFNPHVPKYLLEMKSLILPPEHILKRGDSEAVAYAFFHMQHWKRVEGALNLLHCTWEGTFRMIPYPLEKGHLFYPYPGCTETADRELLPSFHEVSVYPKKELPFFILFTAGLCSFTAMLAMLTHQFPELMGVFAKARLGVQKQQEVPVQGPNVELKNIMAAESLNLVSGNEQGWSKYTVVYVCYECEMNVNISYTSHKPLMSCKAS